MATECTRPGCTNQITPSPKAKRPRLFCSNACRQKAYRNRHVTNRNKPFVTITSYDQVTAALETFTPTQLLSIRGQIEKLLDKQSSPIASLLYFRKGRGVVHLAVDRNVTICSRDTEGMTELDNDEGVKVCQRCATVRDTKTWWQGWREAFGYKA